MTARGIPVCAHLGLTPQSVDALGGFKVQGRDDSSAEQIVADALAVEAAGARMLVLECVPRNLAKTITEKLTIPVMGIGAGPDTDGQVLGVARHAWTYSTTAKVCQEFHERIQRWY